MYQETKTGTKRGILYKRIMTERDKMHQEIKRGKSFVRTGSNRDKSNQDYRDKGGNMYYEVGTGADRDVV